MKMINRVPWHKKLRTSSANNLDKINEIVDYINHSDISEVNLSGSGSGETVVAGQASSLKSLAVDGESAQDGTPTPESPIPMQVVEGRNLLGNLTPGTYTQSGITAVVDENNVVKLSGTATGSGSIIIPLIESVPVIHDGVQLYAHNRNDSTNSLVGFTVQPGTSQYNGPTMGIFSPVNRILAIDLSSIDTIGSLRVYINASLSISGTITCQPSIEKTGEVTKFVPYGCIGLQIGETVTPIDLQGNVLASLPDGTKDVLQIDSAGHVTIEKNVGYIASYNGESVGSVYLSTTGELTTGAEVYYELSTPTSVDLGYIDPPIIATDDEITVLATLTPEITASWWAYQDITDLIADLKAFVESEVQ